MKGKTMYPEECNKVMAQGSIGYAAMPVHNPTVGENIDAKIAYHRKEIERLEESKKTLAPLLGMRIGDIRDAMQF